MSFSFLEIFLLIAGIVVVIATFVFSDLFGTSDNEGIDKETINKTAKEIVKREVEYELANVIDEKVDDTEGKLDKIMNEKMLALGSYSDNVLEDINKNHMEVMFLYNMLTDKEETLKDTMRDIEAIKKSVKQMAVANDFAKIASENNVKKTKTAEKETVETVAETDTEESEVKTEEVVEAVETVEEESAVNREKVNNNQKILELYNKGLSNIEIAKELGLGLGEVKLVIGLFNNTRK